mmetsp:Transcript_22461/g.40555  ORF Transcript_22461/g.40555 Transcript_22461/m.40555 type:complete len:556 (+) Transcript_22461:96-1763(+)|eukprot:CAMPEP_0197626742 /NCGR_PEP_ID=MMETSP1338-20131121/5567_1 /TAXON_ID=43686 ORGANISM="Pelagodinium beii, Strain RCC1491" /NCGR_SAMPLE_ID=MMETSP1338 /ASSEMBLY_ACC=CAM_ASM_000754 /LENGTH=555 /DNA_ID=CAMNT_0043197297 /DNA_START=67 /DNA_END=1734 /DNA_ORIENTATION=-
MPPKAKAKAGGAAAVLARAKSAASLPAGSGASAAAVLAKAKAKGKAKAKAKAGAAAKVASPEDKAASKIQALIRGFLARRLRLRLKEEKAKHDEEMAQAMRAAAAAALRAEQRKQEAERKKQDEKRKKAKKLAADTKAILEAAFDGEMSKVKKLCDEGLPVDAHDANGITGLSEAAAGGASEVARFLLEQKADPNSRGEFQRTPLWRAAYSGQAALAQLLLEGGGDPRLRDEQGQMPGDVASSDDVSGIIGGWDVERTDELVEEFQDWVEQCRFQEESKRREAMKSVDEEYERTKVNYEAAQMMLAKAKSQLRDREKMYGAELAAGHETAIQACMVADAELKRAEAAAEEASRAFDKANVARLAAAEAAGATSDQPGREVMVKELNNVLVRDLGDRIANGSQWTLVVDEGDIAKKLLHYSGQSVLSFFRQEEMDEERLRVSLLSMIRAGGVLAVDLFSFGTGIDRALLSEPFNRISAGLFNDLNSRALLSVPKGGKWQAFHNLITKDEKKDKFSLERFDDKLVARFKFMLLTSSPLPHKELLESFDVIRVVPNPD